MILSVSRRTDIPAFYSEWFFTRLKEGHVLVRNPMNCHQVSKIVLEPSLIDCIVFWTKDPTKIITKLNLLSKYKYYFQITINAYDHNIERNVPRKSQVVGAFKHLSRLIGKEKTIWRYDPIILTAEIDPNFHYKNFELLADKLATYTDRCIISFVDMYRKAERNMKKLNMLPIDKPTMKELGGRLAEIAHKYNIRVETCSEEIDLSSVGIEHAKCIDERLIENIIGRKIKASKDKNQRDICGCISSIDIGAYNTCKHGCLYCYANYSDLTVKNNVQEHDPKSPFLIGSNEPGDKVTVRKMKSLICGYQESKQLGLFSDG